ncbi:MAG TPA: bifunctional shikimate kinase/3-dehydroquinate synthase [Gaiellaceae bacterium]|nr:bifunctional shikimate kinase/3-dehydroquinate synthase [Gaiellaceae bacterium]
MGAGKSTLGEAAALGLGRTFVDADRFIEHDAGRSIPELFAEGEATFRDREVKAVDALMRTPEPLVVALGGGAVTSEAVRRRLAERAVTVWIDEDVDTCWERVRGSDRPLARDEAEFRRLYDERRPLYEEVAVARVTDVLDAILAAAAVHVERGALARLATLVPGDGPVALASDAHVAGIHGMDAQLALGPRLAATHELPQGEAAKQLPALDRLWQELRLDRRGTLAALGGGTTTDAAGFAAATYLRGIDWVPVPTTLVGQVDAAIGGKTAVDLPQGKNLVGAFHWPVRTVIDPALLETLPREQRDEGMAEVVKTALLAGEPLHELPDDELVRRCAAFKAGVCLRDPYDHGPRKQLNLGHTFAHALETAAGYDGLTHGRAVALGLLAALRLSGRDIGQVEELLRPQPVRVDRDAAWEAMQRDKKAVGGELRLVLLEESGPVWDAAVPAEDVRRALDGLIAD